MFVELFVGLNLCCFIYLFQPLPAEEEKQLKEILGTIIGQGKTVKLEQKVCLLIG